MRLLAYCPRSISWSDLLPPPLSSRYEFADNEIVMALASVNLQTKRTPLGLKDYIAVGTGVSRGEDLAERGAVRLALPLSFYAGSLC